MNRFELDKNSFSRGLGRSINMLIEISHNAFNEPFYFINDTRALEHEGRTYQPYAFDITLPNQTETQGTTITLSNVNNYAANEIKKTLGSNENILLNLKFANIENDMAEAYDCGTFELMNITISTEAISGNLNIRSCFEVNAGSIRYSRQLFPNLYK